MTMEFDVIAAAWLYVAAAHALPPPPAPIRLTPEEEEDLAEGGIVVRWTGPDRPTVAVVDVAAPPRRVMDAVMDLPPRVDEISGLRAVEIYREEPGRVAARWEMGVAVYQAHFHIDYAFDLDLGWSIYALDEGRDNDILASEGSYQVYPAGSGSASSTDHQPLEEGRARLDPQEARPELLPGDAGRDADAGKEATMTLVPTLCSTLLTLGAAAYVATWPRRPTLRSRRPPPTDQRAGPQARGAHRGRHLPRRRDVAGPDAGHGPPGPPPRWGARGRDPRGRRPR